MNLLFIPSDLVVMFTYLIVIGVALIMVLKRRIPRSAALTVGSCCRFTKRQTKVVHAVNTLFLERLHHQVVSNGFPALSDPGSPSQWRQVQA
jgi:hypothetical protein